MKACNFCPNLILSLLLLGCTRSRASTGTERIAPSSTTPIERWDSSDTTPVPVFPILYGGVVLQRLLDDSSKVKQPKLVFRADDHDESYLAEAALDGSKLTPRAREIGARDLVAVGPSMPECQIRSNESNLAIYAWAMPEDPTVRKIWTKLSDADVASQVFRIGHKFAIRDQRACPAASWATFAGADLKTHEGKRNDPVPESKASEYLYRLPYGRAWQREYEDFQHAELADNKRATSKYPANWFDLPGQVQTWDLQEESLSGLLVTTFHKHLSADIAGRFNEKPAPWFLRGGLAVWIASQASENPRLAGPLTPAYDAALKCNSVGVLRAGRDTLITFATNGGTGALRVRNNAVVLDEQLVLTPGRQVK